jgi:hypothetical protein
MLFSFYSITMKSPNLMFSYQKLPSGKLSSFCRQSAGFFFLPPFGIAPKGGAKKARLHNRFACAAGQIFLNSGPQAVYLTDPDGVRS